MDKSITLIVANAHNKREFFYIKVKNIYWEINDIKNFLKYVEAPLNPHWDICISKKYSSCRCCIDICMCHGEENISLCEQHRETT